MSPTPALAATELQLRDVCTLGSWLGGGGVVAVES